MRAGYGRCVLLGATALCAGLTLRPACAAPERLIAAAPDVSYGSSVAQTIYLALRDPAGAEAYAQAVQTPGASFHKFLTRAQFVKRFAPTADDIATVERTLTQLGYTITYVFPNHLAIQATAPAAATNAALGITLKRVTVNGHTGIVALGTPNLPVSIRGLARGIGGLDTLHVPHSMMAARPPGPRLETTYQAGSTITGGKPGFYLPQDFAAHYDVNPIYAAGYTGRGATIGIVTLANFALSDAYSFWSGIGLKVNRNRINVVDVDGGTDEAPEGGESSLDVEESGGLAPDAKLQVYVAPDSGQGFTDAFEAAASENVADTVSASWGITELTNLAEPALGVAASTWVFDAFHDVFLEMGIQGQSIYVAAGDNGSYDSTEICNIFGTPSADTPVCNAPYSVDYPGSDPAVTSSGGTTLAYSGPLWFDPAVTVDVPQEQALSNTYIYDQSLAEGNPYPFKYLFSGGTGGGVSAYFKKPYYQQGVAGITRTKPGQSYTQDIGSGPVTLTALPANFAGRNTPDIVTDADEITGYQFISQGQISPYGGGTSFVAPQLNGVTALAVGGLGGRVGLLNNVLYGLGQAATDDIATGDNWGYAAKAGFDNASGLGKLNATRLASALLLLKSIYGR